MSDEPHPDPRSLLHELNRRVLANPGAKRRIIQEFYAEQVQAGNTEGADHVLILRSIMLARSGKWALTWIDFKKSYSRFPRRLILGMAGIAAAALIGYAVTIVGTRVKSENGPHPAFWSRLPRPGQNNLWYDDHNSEMALVFVHGIFSDSRGCWLYENPTDSLKEQYWPNLVAADDRFEHPSIFLGGYATSVDSGPYDARQAAGELRDALKREGVLNRKHIIFIAHSTGGIVVRFLLLHNQELFRDKMVGLALYASPSIGAPLANLFAAISRFYGNELSAQLKRDNTFLTDLDKDFRDLLYNPNSDPSHMRIVGAEGVENFFIFHRRFLPDEIKVVPEDSASHYFGSPVYLRNTDHFSTVKPDSLDHPGHQLLLTFYQKYKKDYGVTR